MRFTIDAYEDFIKGKYNVFTFTEYDKDALEAEQRWFELKKIIEASDSGEEVDLSFEMPDISSKKDAFYIRLRSEYKEAILSALKNQAADCKSEEQLKLFINQQHQFAIAHLNELATLIEQNKLLYDYAPNKPTEINEGINSLIMSDIINVINFIQQHWKRYIPTDAHFDVIEWAKANGDNEIGVFSKFQNLADSFKRKNSFAIKETENSKSNNQPPASQSAKIKTNLTVPQLGFLFAELQSRAILQFSSKTAAIDFAVEHFSSEKKENVSASQARKKSYSLSDKEMEEIANALWSIYTAIKNNTPKPPKK